MNENFRRFGDRDLLCPERCEKKMSVVRRDQAVPVDVRVVVRERVFVAENARNKVEDRLSVGGVDLAVKIYVSL